MVVRMMYFIKFGDDFERGVDFFPLLQVEINDFSYRMKHLKRDGYIDDAIVAFFCSVKLEDYPRFIRDIIDGWCRGYQEMSFQYGPSDEEGTIIGEDEALFGTMFSLTYISKRDLFKLTLEFAQKALEAVEHFNLYNRKLVSLEWIAEIKSMIPELELKVKQSRLP